jgi:hypothetical protein
VRGCGGERERGGGDLLDLLRLFRSANEMEEDEAVSHQEHDPNEHQDHAQCLAVGVQRIYDGGWDPTDV